MNPIIEMIDKFIEESSDSYLARIKFETVLNKFSSYLQSHGYEIVKRECEHEWNNWNVCKKCNVGLEELPESPKLPEKIDLNVVKDNGRDWETIIFKNQIELAERFNQLLDYLHDQRK